MARYNSTINATLDAGETERWVVPTPDDDGVRVDLQADGQPYDVDIATAPTHEPQSDFDAADYVSCLPLGVETYRDTSEHTTATDVVDASVYVEITNNSGAPATFTGSIDTHSKSASDSVEQFATRGTGERAQAWRDGKGLANDDATTTDVLNNKQRPEAVIWEDGSTVKAEGREDTLSTGSDFNTVFNDIKQNDGVKSVYVRGPHTYTITDTVDMTGFSQNQFMFYVDDGVTFSGGDIGDVPVFDLSGTKRAELYWNHATVNTTAEVGLLLARTTSATDGSGNIIHGPKFDGSYSVATMYLASGAETTKVINPWLKNKEDGGRVLDINADNNQSVESPFQSISDSGSSTLYNFANPMFLSDGATVSTTAINLRSASDVYFSGQTYLSVSEGSSIRFDVSSATVNRVGFDAIREEGAPRYSFEAVGPGTGTENLRGVYIGQGSFRNDTALFRADHTHVEYLRLGRWVENVNDTGISFVNESELLDSVIETRLSGGFSVEDNMRRCVYYGPSSDLPLTVDSVVCWNLDSNRLDLCDGNEPVVMRFDFNDIGHSGFGIVTDEDLSATSGDFVGQVSLHDGSASKAAGLYEWDGTDWNGIGTASGTTITP